MAIDKSGEWWVGDNVADLHEYLSELRVEGYAVDSFRSSKCTCGAEMFLLDRDDEEGAARRTCINCNTIGYIGDSAKYFNEENAERYACVECGTESCNVGIGFSLYDQESSDVRWLSVGVRCGKCGVLGCFIDWKVGGGNDADFLQKV